MSSTRRDFSHGSARVLVSPGQLRDRVGARAAIDRYFRIPPSGRRARLRVRAPRHARGGGRFSKREQKVTERPPPSSFRSVSPLCCRLSVLLATPAVAASGCAATSPTPAASFALSCCQAGVASVWLRCDCAGVSLTLLADTCCALGGVGSSAGSF